MLIINTLIIFLVDKSNIYSSEDDSSDMDTKKKRQSRVMSDSEEEGEDVGNNL